jgi:hypothetical protein
MSEPKHALYRVRTRISGINAEPNDWLVVQPSGDRLIYLLRFFTGTGILGVFLDAERELEWTPNSEYETLPHADAERAIRLRLAEEYALPNHRSNRKRQPYGALRVI